jgi:hypothetical protein
VGGIPELLPLEPPDCELALGQARVSEDLQLVVVDLPLPYFPDGEWDAQLQNNLDRWISIASRARCNFPAGNIMRAVTWT